MERTFQNRNDFNSSMSTIMSWSVIVIVLMVLQQQIKTTDAVKFKGDACSSKNEPGICREWSECPILKTLIENGQYTKREIVNCGFGVREEIICCPEVTTTVTEPTNRFEEQSVVISNKTTNNHKEEEAGTIEDIIKDIFDTSKNYIKNSQVSDTT